MVVLHWRDGATDLGIHESGGGLFVLSVRGARSQPATLADTFVAFELELAERLLRGSGAVSLHGSAILSGNGAIVFTGPSGSGKSTLSMGMAASGRPIFGDDVVLLEPETGRIRPFKRLLKLVDPAPRILGFPAPPSILRVLCPDSAFYHPSDIGSLWAPPCTISAVVFPVWSAAPMEPLLTPLSGGETVRRLLDQTLMTEHLGAHEFETIVGSVEGARFFELRFSDSPTAIELLQRHVDRL